MHSLEGVSQFENDRLEHANQLKSRYDIYPDRVEIYDIVHGEEVFNAPIFVELANHDALRRLQTVEQLTLPDRYKTIPASTNFARWEHVWGVAIFAKRSALEMGMSEAEADEYALCGLLSDLVHSAHSHALDWIIEGPGGPEILHDERKLQYAEAIGISEILRRHGHEPKKILSDEVDGILNARMPDLDADRIDYTLREGYRWVDQIPEYREILNRDSFMIKDGRMVCKTIEAAQLFGITYVLLATEHWQEPPHRLQLELFMESIKRVLVAREGRNEAAGTYSPLDFLMTTDDTLQRLAREDDVFLPVLHKQMRAVSDAETEYRWLARAERVRAALTTGLGNESRSIEWIAAHYDGLPPSFEIEPADKSNLRRSKYATIINLKKLRKRSVDPPFWDAKAGEVRALSEADPAFAEYATLATANVQKDWRAAIIVNEVTTAALQQCLKENAEKWPEVLERPRMPNSVLRQHIRETVRTSNGAASHMIDLNVHN